MKIFILLLISLYSVCCRADTYLPEIEVGYVPDPSSLEGGFWYQVDKIEEELKYSPKIFRDENINNYISSIVCQVAAEYCSQIRVYIVRNPHFNASMYPNGMMHINTGLLLRVSSEAELASVIGHEIAHYLKIHQIKNYRRAKSTMGAAMFADLVIAGFTGVYGLVSLGAMGDVFAYSRDAEAEADALGMKLMIDAGYDASAPKQVWAYLDEERQADKSKQKRNPFFASHPKIHDRFTLLSDLQEKLNVEGEGKVNADKFVSVMSVIYPQLMTDQISLREHEQTELMLKKHKDMGYPASQIQYFTGLMYRDRGKEGDDALAYDYLLKSVNSEDVTLSSAYKELAYLAFKKEEYSIAKENFIKYLYASPEAEDRSIIEYYIGEMESENEG